MLSQQHIEEFGRSFIFDPDHLQRFLDGIALAEGLAPAETATTNSPPHE
jgi:hypothetical protein